MMGQEQAFTYYRKWWTHNWIFNIISFCSWVCLWCIYSWWSFFRPWSLFHKYLKYLKACMYLLVFTNPLAKKYFDASPEIVLRSCTCISAERVCETLPHFSKETSSNDMGEKWQIDEVVSLGQVEPRLFALWSRIVKRTNSTLWLLKFPKEAVNRLRKEVCNARRCVKQLKKLCDLSCDGTSFNNHGLWHKLNPGVLQLWMLRVFSGKTSTVHVKFLSHAG